MTEITQFHFR